MFCHVFINTTYCTNATIYSFLERCDVDLGISLICSLLSKHDLGVVNHVCINKLSLFYIRYNVHVVITTHCVHYYYRFFQTYFIAITTQVTLYKTYYLAVSI